MLWGNSDLISKGNQASSKKGSPLPKIQSELISDGLASPNDKIYQQKNNVNEAKNEAVPSGTKTSFLGIGLNNIITNFQPNFKSKVINNKNIIK